MKNEPTYGFSRSQASSLVSLIGGEAPIQDNIPGGAGSRLVRFVLLANLSSGTASATIKFMDGTTLGTHNVLDPEAVFSELTTSDTGLAFLQGGKFYVIQAPCGA